MRVNASHHATCRTSHAGRDARVSSRQQHSQFRWHRPQADLWPAGGRLTGPKLPRFSQERQRNRARVSRQDERTQQSSNHPFDRPLERVRRHRAACLTAAPLSTVLHARRYQAAGRDRCRSRRPLGSSRASHPAARIPGLPQGRPQTIGLHLGLPHLQPAAHPNLSRTPRPSHQDPLLGGEHWRAPQARSTRPAWLGAGRRRAPGRHGEAQGSTTSMLSTR